MRSRRPELTKEELEALPKHTIFADGYVKDSPDGCNMTNSGTALRWIAQTGEIGDWCIYIAPVWAHLEWIASHGDKVYSSENIKYLMPCDNEAYAMYRF